MQEHSSDFSPRTYSDSLSAFVGLLVGAAIGIKFADIDQHVPDILLHHRALLTHGFLISLLLGWITRRTKYQAWRGITIGFSVTNAVHLCFDLFPRSWWGYALIHIFTWGLPPLLSWLWIAASIVLCIYIARFFVHTIWDILISIGGIIAAFIAHAHEGFFWPLVACIIGGIIAFLIPIKGKAFSVNLK